MFKVKATVIGFDKDEQRFPCHFRYKVGEEITYDGEMVTGRICPSLFSVLGQAFNDLQASGGRHQESENPKSYYPFWHSPYSAVDPSRKKYDGVGFRATTERPEMGYKFVADKTLWGKPPDGKYIIGKGTAKRDLYVVCEDSHTNVRFKVEAYDLADRGDSLPYFRRTMSILDKIVRQPGIAMDKILNEFTSRQINDIYPTLGQNLIAVLVGELELMGYVVVNDDRVTATAKGKRKLKNYIAGLTPAEKKALKL